MKQTICDKCKIILEEYKYKAVWVWNGSNTTASPIYEYQLCEKCQQELIEFIEKPLL